MHNFLSKLFEAVLCCQNWFWNHVIANNIKIVPEYKVLLTTLPTAHLNNREVEQLPVLQVAEPVNQQTSTVWNMNQLSSVTNSQSLTVTISHPSTFL